MPRQVTSDRGASLGSINLGSSGAIGDVAAGAVSPNGRTAMYVAVFGAAGAQTVRLLAVNLSVSQPKVRFQSQRLQGLRRPARLLPPLLPLWRQLTPANLRSCGLLIMERPPLSCS